MNTFPPLHPQFIYAGITFLVVQLLLSAACSHPDMEAERHRAFSETVAKIQSCAPDNPPEENVKLAIASVARQPTETTLRLVAYSLDKPADFDLPVYLLSRGRWLINEKGRAYLLDEQCREYKLKDRNSSTGREIPLDGRIRLDTGQAFEAILRFPRLPDEVQMGVLVYGQQVLPFLISSR